MFSNIILFCYDAGRCDKLQFIRLFPSLAKSVITPAWPNSCFVSRLKPECVKRILIWHILNCRVQHYILFFPFIYLFIYLIFIPYPTLMPYICPICSKPWRTGQASIKCTSCHNWIHHKNKLNCSKMTDSEFINHSNDCDREWLCDCCVANNNFKALYNLPHYHPI